MDFITTTTTTELTPTAIQTFTGIRRSEPTLILLTCVAVYSAYVLQGAPGILHLVGSVAFVGLDAGKKWVGGSGTRSKEGAVVSRNAVVTGSTGRLMISLFAV